MVPASLARADACDIRAKGPIRIKSAPSQLLTLQPPVA